MKKILLFTIFSFALSFMLVGQRDTLHFDDLPATAGAIIPVYKGFVFGPGQGCAYTNDNTCGYGANKTSTPHVSYNLGVINQLTYEFSQQSGDPFTFISLQLGLGWNCNGSVLVEGLSGGTAIFSEEVTDISANGPAFLVEACETVDMVRLTLQNQGANCCAAGAGPFMTVDDIIVAQANFDCAEVLKPLNNGTSVPTMTQWGLFLFGLIVLTLGVVYVYNLSVSSAKVQE